MEKPSQITFRYRATASATGVSRSTAKRLAAALGVDETQAIHIALRQLAAKILPQYLPDDGALLDEQIRQIRSAVGEIGTRSVRSALFDEKG